MSEMDCISPSPLMAKFHMYLTRHDGEGGGGGARKRSYVNYKYLANIYEQEN